MIFTVAYKFSKKVNMLLYHLKTCQFILLLSFVKYIIFNFYICYFILFSMIKLLQYDILYTIIYLNFFKWKYGTDIIIFNIDELFLKLIVNTHGTYICYKCIMF